MKEKNAPIKTNSRISVFGDMHPKYAGSVVKALASAKNEVDALICSLDPNPSECDFSALKKGLTATVVDIIPLGVDIHELIIHAPYAAKNFRPGQFFKLQNYESLSNGSYFEPIALTGASADTKKGTISLIVLQNGRSTVLSSKLTIGQQVVLMGPSGEPTFIPENKNILLIGGGVGNAVLFSIGKEAIQKNNRVLYIAGYKTENSRFKTEEIEHSSHKIIWACNETVLQKNRDMDASIKGTIIDALYSCKEDLTDIDYIIAIGSDQMMKAVSLARFHTLKDYFKKDPKLIGSINSPMQCMMKGICGQCVQVLKTEEGEKIIFTCQNQDQDLQDVDFDCLNNRLKQNSLLEKINQ